MKQSESPYIVTDDVTVLEGVTLVIEPGTEIRFAAKKSLKVFGELIARGIKDKNILFTAHSEKPKWGFWGGITAFGDPT